MSYQRLYLTSDGQLAGAPSTTGEVTWTHDPTTGVAERPSRWDNAPGLPQSGTDQRVDGERSGATLMTPTLTTDLTLAGPISLRLQMSSVSLTGSELTVNGLPDQFSSLVPPCHDTDIVVKLSDMQPDEAAILITEGFLRASHRALDTHRSVVVDGDVVVPHHPHTRAAVQPVPPGEMVKMSPGVTTKHATTTRPKLTFERPTRTHMAARHARIWRPDKRSVRGEDFRGLRHLADRLGENLIGGFVLYTGTETLPFGPRFRAMPISALWETAP